jgi:hypothetical protein
MRQLRREERVERPNDCPACQEIDATTPQLSGARFCQDESAPRATLHQIVDDVQKLGCPLHFVHYDVGSVRIAENQFAEPLRSGAHVPKNLRPKQVYKQAVRQSLS